MAACFRAIDGGLDLAVEAVTGAKPEWFVEFDKAPSKILAHHWPNVPNFGDVTKVNWGEVPKVDILTGGYPCQPFSNAGKRKGKNDERHLWPYVFEAIRTIRPRFAFLENVAGHRSLGFDTVLADLATGGAHVWWTSLRASDVGAPHHRERVFILAAYPESIGQLAGQLAGRSEAEKPWNNDSGFPFSPDRPVSENMEVFGRYSGAVRWWERASRLDAPEPVRLNSNGKRQLNAEFPEWMMGLERGWVTSPDIGLPRTKQLKAIGNGVCPQQAEVALRYLLQMVNETDKTEVSVG